jgi:hypothetical protein
MLKLFVVTFMFLLAVPSAKAQVEDTSLTELNCGGLGVEEASEREFIGYLEDAHLQAVEKGSAKAEGYAGEIRERRARLGKIELEQKKMRCP